MKLRKLSAMFLLLPLMSGCSTTIDYQTHLDDYVYTMKYHDHFVIAQISDLHWSNATNVKQSEDYLTALISEIKQEKGQIDLLVFTGDQFMLASKDTVCTFTKMMERIQIPYATVWGNHDFENTYTKSWIQDHFRDAPYSIYQAVDHDNVYGESNYIINLTANGKKDGEVKYQLAMLDSGGQLIDQRFSLGAGYDYIREDQVEWWKAEHDQAGSAVPTIMYYHIHQESMVKAYEAYEKDPSAYKAKYYKLEGWGGNKLGYDNLFETAKNNNVKAMFMGHCHANDFTIDYEGVTLGFGVKTGPELYYGKISQEKSHEVGLDQAFDLQGSSVVTLNGSSFELEHCYFNKTEGANFVEWVKY